MEGKENGLDKKRHSSEEMGRSQKLCTFVTWNPKVKTFRVLTENIPNNSRIHVPICRFKFSENIRVEIIYFTF